MEVEEFSQPEEKQNTASNSQVDVDSGIENMEVEESKETSQQRTSSTSDNADDQVCTTISKVLCVSWSQGQQSDSNIFLSETAAGINQRKQEGDSQIDTQDLISQSHMEVICQIALGENPLPSPLTCSTPEDSSEAMPATATTAAAPSLATTGLAYLTDCYARVGNHPKRSSLPPLKEVLAEIRAQCVQHTSLMLQDVLVEEVDFTSRLGPLSSPLLQPVLNQTLPRGFLPELLARTHSNPDTLNKVN